MKGIIVIFLLINQYSFCQLTKLKAGSSKPGFMSLTRLDESRPAIKEQPQKDKGRIIQINIWYPSAANTRRTHF